MAGPTTEVLNDDLKEIRSELHRVEVTLVNQIHQIDNTLTHLVAEFGLFKWLLGLTLIATLSGIGSSIWWAATTTNRIGTLEGRVDRIESKLDRLDARLGVMDGRLERIESSIAKALGSAGAITPTTEKR